MNMSVGIGVGLLAGLDNQPKLPEEYSFTLNGDLNQMAEQMIHLRKQGFDVQKRNVYPVIKRSDKKAALQSIYRCRVPGWWHYEKEYVQFGICTSEEFRKELHDECEREKHQRDSD